MGKLIGHSPILKDYLDPSQILIDTLYQPYETQFLKEGKAIGAKILNGLKMLLFQGARFYQNLVSRDFH